MGNFIRFHDAVTFKPLSIEKDIKDFYTTSQSQGQSLNIRIAATHSGKITRNNGFYLPHKMKSGTSSFTSQYKKPILLHHDDHADPIGRVESARYIDISQGFRSVRADSLSVGMDKTIEQLCKGQLSYKDACSFVSKYFVDNTSLSEDPDYEGLGYIELVASISDQDAITRILDGRYLTGSTGASTNKAVCSVCKTNWADEDGRCEHTPGKKYEDAKCVLIAGDLTYDEYSFVNKPADRHSGVIEVNVGGIQDFVKTYEEKDSIVPEITLVMADKTIEDQDIKGIQMKLGESEGHKHIAHLDEDGDGETDWVEDHTHRVTAFVVAPARTYKPVNEGMVGSEENEPHTHELRNPLKKAKDAAKSEEDNKMTFKDAYKLVSENEKFKDVKKKDLTDAVKKIVDENKDLDDKTLLVLAAEASNVKLEDEQSTEESEVEVKDEKTEEEKAEEVRLADEAKVKDDAVTPEVETPKTTIEDADLLKMHEDIKAVLAERKLSPEEKKDETSEDKTAELEAKIAELETALDASKIEVTKLVEEKTAEVQEKLDAARKENRYLHDDIEALQDQLTDAKLNVRKEKVIRIADLTRLSGETVEMEALEDSLKEKSAGDVDGLLKDLTEKVDILKIVDTLNSGLSNNPSGTVDDPTSTVDNTQDTKKVVFDSEIAQKVTAKYMHLRMQPNGQQLANQFIKDCKAKGIIPAEMPIEDKS